MSKVVVLRCESYDYNLVKSVVQKGIEMLGGVSQFAKKGEKILLKPNLLVGDIPEKCTNTHFSVFKAVAEIFKTTGAVVSYGDSPSFGSGLAASKKCGLVQAASEVGIDIKEFNEGRQIHFAEGRQNKQFTIATAVLESDGVISLPKLKTHGFQKFTGCVKNQFGCIPGLLKGEFHVKLPDALAFAKMLVDLDRCVNPRLYIMDGVMAMEGNGPRGGNPRKMNVLLFSPDAIALDATVCRMINVDPALVPTITYGREFGHGVFETHEIELLGDNPEEFRINDFNVDRGPVKPFRARGILGFLSNAFVAKPVINKRKCVKCGICIKVCPANPKAVNWRSGDTSKPPVHDYKLCIRCYCCQELCPEKAISLRRPALRRLFAMK
jgi:uncharacterized protein (DUF362 family)/Pyruvate/2-oxoacid:ferredoxin oxidoreductase delta subunit